MMLQPLTKSQVHWQTSWSTSQLSSH
jgi:hypothetical protein